ncbi:MAG TPA: saccharopine dehydrogenase NADP-binding domain-containing protein [Acidimicrobiia bacterium]|nr:saccharopine dehydrogenase NADP-binding domain-containing protein [Acidimicrobiia bacterium]
MAARRAVDLGHSPTLLGRDEERLASLAGELDLPHAAVALEDGESVRAALEGLAAVLHCAGPFQDTTAMMLQACLDTGTHYLDITGELDVIEATATRTDEATSKGVVLMSAVGFDVVPSDCLAVHLSNRLPTATRLTIALDPNTRPSHGTATTALRGRSDAAVRRDGRLVSAPVASKQRIVDFGFDRGEATASLIKWADLATAYRSTGIGNIETYAALPPDVLLGLKIASRLGFLIRVPVFARTVIKSLTGGEHGPSEAQREADASWLFGEVEDDGGARAAARLRMPHAYTLTAWTSVETTVRVAAGGVAPGFQTPATAFGPDFILEFDGVEREDI